MQTMITAQMKVLNDSYAGLTSATAADSPFRFDLTKTTYTVNPAWYTVVPGKNERDMKKALYEGDATTLNVYVANIGGGLLGWAYFPKGYNNGRDFIDGVVMLDESMPGGHPDRQVRREGDTLTHEVGHWLMLEHTFAHGCSASGDYVTDTPKEAGPQFDCPVGADTCAAPGLDPIHNFMDYTQDSCMNEFTPGPGRADERRAGSTSARGPRPDASPAPRTTPDAGRARRDRHPASARRHTERVLSLRISVPEGLTDDVVALLDRTRRASPGSACCAAPRSSRPVTWSPPTSRARGPTRCSTRCATSGCTARGRCGSTRSTPGSRTRRSRRSARRPGRAPTPWCGPRSATGPTPTPS